VRGIGQQRDILFGEGPRILAADADCANAIAFPEHGRDDHRAHADRCIADAAVSRNVCIRGDVRDVFHGPGEDGVGADGRSGDDRADGFRLSVEPGPAELYFVPTIADGEHVKFPHCPIRYPKALLR